MERRRPARRRVGGGEIVQAPRTAGPRLATAALSLAVLAAGALSLAARVDRLELLVAAAGLLSLLLLAVGLAGRFASVLPWALAFAGAEYAAFLVIGGDAIDAYAPLYGAGLLLVAELAYWSIDRHVPGPGERLSGRRASLAAAAVLAAGGIGGVILTMAELSVSGGLALEILGVAAAVGALALVAYLARPPRGESPG